LARALGDIPKAYEELIDVGEHVVVLLRDRGRRKDMETDVELIGATILTFRDGKLARWGDYAERAAAFEAVGLSEQDARADS
jgi:ketosteroid isomerase-like protein